jgi:hypothetical protein
MVPDVYAHIQAFLQQQTIVPLISGETDQPEHYTIKAGVVPFVRVDADFTYFVMKPVPKRPGLGAPAYQLCKGTRQHFLDGRGWCDLRDGEITEARRETLAQTALREGIEELGLRLDGIVTLFDVGPYAFSSARSGRQIYMWLFAAELVSPEAVLPMAEVAATTAERGWVKLDEFRAIGRDDHRPILQDIAAKVERHYSRESSYSAV